MKRYKIEYWDIDRSKPYVLIQMSKSGKWDGVRIYFLKNGGKKYQYKWKNDLIDGMCKDWWCYPVICFSIWKKSSLHGIKITLK